MFVSLMSSCKTCQCHLGGISVKNTKQWALVSTSMAMGTIQPLSFLEQPPLYPLALIPESIIELGQAQYHGNGGSMDSEFFDLLRTAWESLNFCCCCFLSLWVGDSSGWGQLWLVTALLVDLSTWDVPDNGTVAWTSLCCGKLPFAYKVFFALIIFPFLPYASLSACSAPALLPTVLGFRNKFTQNGKVYLRIAKRCGPITAKRCGTIYRGLNYLQMVMDGSLYPTCYSFSPSYCPRKSTKTLRNTVRIIRKIMESYLKCMYSYSCSILNKTRRDS